MRFRVPRCDASFGFRCFGRALTRARHCADAGSRKTLIYLILTLNHMYPDWDFSNLRAHVRRVRACAAARSQLQRKGATLAVSCDATHTRAPPALPTLALLCVATAPALTPCACVASRRAWLAQHFTKEDGFARTRADIDALLLEPARLWAGVAAAGGAQAPAHALEALWARLDEVIQARWADARICACALRVGVFRRHIAEMATCVCSANA
jgi:hypothetical protein